MLEAFNKLLDSFVSEQTEMVLITKVYERLDSFLDAMHKAKTKPVVSK